MALRLPRLPKDLALVNSLGRVSVEFQRWWQSAMLAIENVLIDLTETIARVATTETDIAAIEAVTFTAGNGLTGGGGILTSPSFAVGAGTGIDVSADAVAVSAKLQAYHGGDTPSAFTLGIVDSADAAAWRTAIGAGTGSGTVTSVAASVPTGFSIAGSPVTTSGTLAISYSAGYQGYTTAEAAKVAGAALTRTNDTNVTLTLGGAPTTALLEATSLTLGWTGTLAVARGGTGVASSTGSTAVVLSNLPQFTSTIGVGVAASASGSGVSFPATQSASTDPNTLDDYEEGTWTPTIAAAAGAGFTASGTGRYTKIGNVVTASFTFTISANGTGASYITVSAPFTNGSSLEAGSAFEYAATNKMIHVHIGSGGTTFNLSFYDGTYPGGTGYTITGKVVYFV